MYINELNEDIQKEIELKLEKAIRETGLYTEKGVKEHLERGMSSRIHDLSDSIDISPYLKHIEIKELVKAIADFRYVEYETDPAETREEFYKIKEGDSMGIAYTTLGDNEELEIQVSFYPHELILESNVYGDGVNVVENLSFDNIEQAIDIFKYCSFENMITLEEHDVDELINKAILFQIVQKNNELLEQVQFDIEKAMKLGKVYVLVDENSGQIVHDFFHDPTLQVEVDPYEEYDHDALEDIVDEYYKYVME